MSCPVNCSFGASLAVCLILGPAVLYRTGAKYGLLGNRSRRRAYPSLSWLHRLDREVQHFPAERGEIDPQMERHGPYQKGCSSPDTCLDLSQPIPNTRKRTRLPQRRGSPSRLCLFHLQTYSQLGVGFNYSRVGFHTFN